MPVYDVGVEVWGTVRVRARSEDEAKGMVRHTGLEPFDDGHVVSLHVAGATVGSVNKAPREPK